MKKIALTIAVMVATVSVASAASWVSKSVKAVTTYEGDVSYVVADTTAATNNEYVVYNGTGASDATVQNRIMATFLTALSSGKQVQFYTSGKDSANVYQANGIRVTGTDAN